MYAPANKCIYCGRADVSLSREHIIPYSLGESLVLQNASCADHADLTSALEREVARDTYGIHRAHERIQTRRKGRHEETLSTKTTVEGIDKNGTPATAHIAISDQPRLPMVVRLQVPGILRRGCPSDFDSGVTLQCEPADQAAFARLRERLQWQKITISSPPVRQRAFLRVLAKIAHAFACAELSFMSYRPTLLPLILGEPVSGTYLVGGFDPEKSQAVRPLLLREVELEGQALLIADISLHFFPLLPKYQVVCGARHT